MVFDVPAQSGGYTCNSPVTQKFKKKSPWQYRLKEVVTEEDEAILRDFGGGDGVVRGKPANILLSKVRRSIVSANQTLREVSTTATGNPVVIRLYVTNTGHSRAVVKAVIRGCSYGFGSASTDQVPLYPGQTLLMLLSVRLEGSMPTADVWCTVALESNDRGVLTSRSVLIRPKGHCICYLHCQCMCLGELVECKAESAANRDKRNTNTKPSAAPVGKVTSPPTTSSSHFYEIPEPLLTASTTEDTADPLSCGLSVTTIILEILLCLGLFKATLGLVSPPVARWGLQNYIAQLKHSSGTGTNDSATCDLHEERRVGAGTIFCMNIFYFCMLPFIFCGRRKRVIQTQREELEDKIFGFDAAGPQRL
ncbi:uncharacterized protein LOC119401270 [Rhipicephalus sanguineus]|uniref:uncharacterized protein LOC119401270 n=1 Tax=Rhipicephalus sanguineus TaxID=34632 RepID=UPI0020C308ED|nr:uncharacterized protein LOC119401270 [Rhipicephalus sanguineus]